MSFLLFLSLRPEEDGWKKVAEEMLLNCLDGGRNAAFLPEE